MPLIQRSDFELAVKNIASLGDTDIFPWLLENHILHDSAEPVIDLLTAMSGDFQRVLAQQTPVTESALSPLGYNGFRWATQIDPIWNAYYLGAVLSLAAEIESRRVPVDRQIVFSHRFAPGEDGHLFDRMGWSKYQVASAELARGHAFVVSVDIADFYGRIYHHRIENELREVDGTTGRAAHLMGLLTSFSRQVSYGLPVGGPASRIISELVLNATDQLLLVQSPSFTFTRYADDYRFFVNDRESAYRAIGFLSEKLQRIEGLSLQRSKTRIMTSAEFLSSNIPQDPRPGSAAKFLSLHLYYDPYSPTADDDYERLREQLDEFDVLGLLREELFKGRVDQALTKKLVSALRHMQPVPKEQAVLSLAENLETLAPVLPHVLRAMRDNLKDLSDDGRAKVSQTIRELIESKHHLAQVDVNLAYMVRVLAQERRRENSDLLMRLYREPHGYAGAPAAIVQRDIVLAMGRWRARFWLRDLKPHYGTMHPWVARAFLVASYALGDEGRHWRRAVRPTLSPFDSVVADWASTKSGQSSWEIPV